MAELKQKITRLRQNNWDSKRFIPHHALESILTPEQIRIAMKESGVEATSLDEMANTIWNKARKIFAILVLIDETKLIAKFLGEDGYLESEIDARLPFDGSYLERLVGNKDFVRNFRETQLEFVAPIFSGGILPRVLTKEIILPFMENEPIGRGGFGNVSRIRIHPAHQTINSGGLVCNPKTNDYSKTLRLNLFSLLERNSMRAMMPSICVTIKNCTTFLFYDHSNTQIFWKSKLHTHMAPQTT
jgi:hypothetical protein